MQLSSCLALVVTGVGTLLSGSALAASLSIELTSTIDGTTYGTSPATPVILQPELDGTVGAGHVTPISALLNAPDQGTYQNAEVTVVLPAGLRLESQTLSGFTFAGCGTFNAALASTCRWTRASHVGTGSNGIPLTMVVKALAMRFRDGQAVTVNATFTATGFVPSGGGAASVTGGSDALYGEIDAVSGLYAGISKPSQAILASRYGYGPDGVTQGYIETFIVGLNTIGTGGTPFTSNIVDDVEVTVSLPSGSVFTALRVMGTMPAHWTATSTPTSLTLSWDEAAGPWVSGFPSTGSAGIANQFSSGQQIWLEAFMPCANFASNTNAADLEVTGTAWATNAAGQQMTHVAGAIAPGVVKTGTVGGGNYLFPVWTTPGTAPVGAPWCVDTANAPAGVRQGGSVTKADNDMSENDILAGTTESYFITLDRPVGEPTLTNVFWVDRLPNGLWSPAGGAVGVTGSDGVLDTWFCDLSAYPEEQAGDWVNFAPDDIDLANDCTLDPGGNATAPVGTTHIVFTADTLGGAADLAWSGLSNIPITVSVTFPLGYVGTAPGNEARNQTWAYADFTRLGAPATMSDLANSTESYATDGVADASYTNAIFEYNVGNDNNTWDVNVNTPAVAGVVKAIPVRQPRANALADAQPITVPLATDANPAAQRFDLVFEFDGKAPVPPTAPVFRVTLPDGFVFATAPSAASLVTGANNVVLVPGGAIYYRVTSTCGAAAPVTSFTANGNVLTWRTSSAYTLADSQVSNGFCAGIALELYADPNHGFVNGEVVAFTADLLYEGPTGDALLDTMTLQKSLGVSPAVDFAAALSCTGDGSVHVDVTAENAGGQPFTELVSRVDLPAGVDQAAVLASIAAQAPLVAPTSAAFVGNTLVVTWTGATVLAPYTTGLYGFDVPWASGALSLVSTGSAVATSEGVQTNVSSTSNEIRSLDTASCPATLIVDKRFGTASGAPMGGIGFTLDGALQTTGSDGRATFTEVLPGSRTLAEVTSGLPGNATWSSTGTGVIDVPPNATVTVVVVNTCACGPCGGTCGITGECLTNACDDGDTCTVDACVDDACTHTAITCADDGNACTADTCVDGACAHPPVTAGTACETDDDLCSAEQCDDTGACVVTGTVDCLEGDLCTPYACNPSSGQCEAVPNPPLPDPCDRGGAIVVLPVTGPNGQTGFVLCGVVPPGYDGNGLSTFSWICRDDDHDGHPDILTAAQTEGYFGAGFCGATPDPK